MDVSVIIVNWNTKDLLKSCLQSIYERTSGLEFEIIVVDNASTDGSAEMVKHEFPAVRLIVNPENLGFARANNIGIRKSTGRYICLVNSDVTILDKCINNLVSFMDSRPSIGMVGPRVLNADGTIQHSCRHFPTIWNNFCQALWLNHLFPKSAFFSHSIMDYWSYDSVKSIDVLSGCFWMVRREVLNNVGLLDEEFFFYGEDIDWCRRIRKAGWDIVFYPNAEIIHIKGASSACAPLEYYLAMQKADLQYWKKHHGNIGRFSYAAVILLREIIRFIGRGFQFILQPAKRKHIRPKLRRNIAGIRLVLHI